MHFIPFLHKRNSFYPVYLDSHYQVVLTLAFKYAMGKVTGLPLVIVKKNKAEQKKLLALHFYIL